MIRIRRVLVLASLLIDVMYLDVSHSALLMMGSVLVSV